MSVDIYTNSWDPFLALLKIKSYGILVDIGKLNHHEKIADNIAKMAKVFYRIHVLERTIRARRQILALHQNRINYGKSRLEQGAYDSLTLRSLQNSARGERMKIAGLEREKKEKVSELKALMGYHPDFDLPLDTRDAANQILNGFNGNLVTFATVQGQNLSLKVLAKQEQLQSNKVTGSYVALVPKPLLTVEGLDNIVDRTSGLNVSIGLDYTLWDGFRKVREIKKQKMRAEQLRIDRSQLSQKLYLSFKGLRGEVEGSGEQEGFYREQAKLAELSEEKAFLSYKAGNLPYDDYITRRMERVEAEISSVGSAEGKVTALIDLATIAGGLNKYNAAISF
jgi:outer membrane protein TolC